jgi:adenylosuccinate synthase
MSMAIDVVLGLQWGDEGKGKIVDLLAERADVVARYQGGPNAGHTVVHGDQKFILHMIPSGILSSHAECLIGNGVVVDPPRLLQEIETLRKAGVDAPARLRISLAAHMILPQHIMLDELAEGRRGAIGTTKRGVGIAYGDKVLRWGLRLADLLDDDHWQERLHRNLERHLPALGPDFDLDRQAKEIIERVAPSREILRPLAVDGPQWLWDRMRAGKRLLAEGAQGAMLDIDHGTYPFLTSSNTTTGGVCTGLGVPPSAIGQVWGVTKAYTTRVGEGPFPSEQINEQGEALRQTGNEYGATTGRPRRCGWLDVVVLRRTVALCGATKLALTKLDVLDQLAEIPVAVAYETESGQEAPFPQTAEDYARIRPRHRNLPGWQTSTRAATRWSDLPKKAQEYIAQVEEMVGVPIGLISIGSDRRHSIWRE